jgi:hypothetical protein
VNGNPLNLSTSGGGGVSSFTGDGTILSNSASTGAVTATLENAPANEILAGPISGSAAAPTYRALVVADLPPTTLSSFSGFWGGLGLNTFGTETGSATGFTANAAYSWLFYLDHAVTVTKASLYVATPAASTAASIGIYSTGGSKLVDSGVFTTTTGGTGTGVASQTIVETSVLLPVGWYYFVFTSNSASSGFQYFYTAANVCSILNKNATRIGNGTATTGGALNTTLGSLTAEGSYFMPCAWFE